MQKRAIALAAVLLAAATGVATAQPGRMQAKLFHVPLAPPPVYPLSIAPTAESIECPPKGFPTLRDFNVTAYIAAPWYVQQQLPLDYQPPDQLYCVKAEYELRDTRTIEAGLVVNNYANRGAVNGPSVGSSKYDRNKGPRLIALPDTRPFNNVTDGRLLVGPELLLALLPGALWRTAFGPYWVVAVGPSANATLQYDWAIVSGGAPIYPVAGDGCSTLPPARGVPGANSGGMGTGGSGSGSAAGYGFGGAAPGVYGGGAGASYSGTGGAYGGAAGVYGGAAAGFGGAARVYGGSGGGYGGASGAYGRASGGYGGSSGGYGGVGGGYGGPQALFPGASGAGGGAPGGGRPGPTTFDKGGLWLLSRKAVDPDGVTAMRNRAQQMGLDIRGLLPVAHEGCRYKA